MRLKGKEYRTIWFEEETNYVKIIDQTKLPHQFVIKDWCYSSIRNCSRSFGG